MDDRRVALLAGALLIALGVTVSGLIHDSAVAGVLTLAGAVLVLWAFVGDRLESFGPSGAKFREVRDEIAGLLELKTSVAPWDLDMDADVITQTSQTTALIRAAKTPEELAQAIVKIAEPRPESRFEQMERVRRDDEMREARARMGGGQGGPSIR